MSTALPFSEIVTEAFTVSRKLLKKYFLAMLLLLAIVFVTRLIGSGIVALPSLFPTVSMPVKVSAFIAGGVFILVSFIVQVVMQIYPMVLAIHPKLSVRESIRMTFYSLVNLFLIGLWIGLRSYMWIMIFGLPFFFLVDRNPLYIIPGIVFWIAAMACAIIFMPRFIFANIIYLQERTDIRKSVQLSYERTEGYWGKIMGNHFLMMACITASIGCLFFLFAILAGVVVALNFFAGQLTSTIVGIPLGIGGILIFISTVFFVPLLIQVFFVELYETIKLHPRKK